MATKWQMRQSYIFHTPPEMRLCLIQTVKLFLITGLSTKQESNDIGSFPKSEFHGEFVPSNQLIICSQ